MKALIVEDHVMFRELLVKSCERYLNRFEIVSVGRAAAARTILQGNTCAVMLLDIHLPDADGFDFAAETLLVAPNLKIVGISAYCDAYTAHRLVRSKLDAFIDKSTQTVTELGLALQMVAEGRKYYSPSIQAVLRKLGAAPDSFTKILSDRGICILREVGKGNSDERIARLLKIAPATVKWHRKQLMHKLGLCSHTELVIYANKEGFSDIRDVPDR
jgi:DNA-binding NarL/FixJ family response regulator